MPESDGEFRGATKAQIETLFHAVERVEKGMEAHGREEKEVWRDIGAQIAALDTKWSAAIEQLRAELAGERNWRARAVGYAAGFSTAAGFLLHYLWDRWTKGGTP